MYHGSLLKLHVSACKLFSICSQPSMQLRFYVSLNSQSSNFLYIYKRYAANSIPERPIDLSPAWQRSATSEEYFLTVYSRHRSFIIYILASEFLQQHVEVHLILSQKL